ncbi:MAG: ComF family protein [Bacteroidota bacterium]
MTLLSQFLTDFVQLIYPMVCHGCGANLLKNERVLCTSCLVNLPRTNYHTDRDNPVSQLFWGRSDIFIATAWYRFKKGSSYQELIHKLKYCGAYEIGYELGKHFGSELMTSPWFSKIDYIVPVPLHPERLKKRGYNQAECIARGMSVAMKVPLETENLCRTKYTSTQTNKTRIERWANVESIFSMTDPGKYERKCILLVDDIITTGATLEACANTIQEAEGVKILIAALGFTSR